MPVDNIRANPYQPRQDFDEAELEELAASIKEKGVIQPLVARNTATGCELIAGERRLRASRIAGFAEVPVRVLSIDSEAEMLELSLIENLQRHDLNPVELAQGYQRLHDSMGLTQVQIADRVGKERATIANFLRLLELPGNVLQSLRDGEISAGHAKAILALPGPARQSAVWKKVVENGLSVRQTEQLVKEHKNESERLPVKPKDSVSPLLNAYMDRLRQKLGTQVKITRKGRKGNIRIEFYSEEELERLIELITGLQDDW